MKRFLSIALVLLVTVTGIDLSPALAAPTTLSLTLRQTPSIDEPIVTLYGHLKPARAGIRVSIQVELDNRWRATSLNTKTTSSGAWKIEAVATALDASVNYRAFFYISGKRIYSPARSIDIQQPLEIANADPTALIQLSGPGGRIHGLDISRWQHPNGAAIDFVKMYAAGVRFVMIKASDTKDLSDEQALKYVTTDHSAAQAAGIYTGFYHYAILPDSTDPTIIVRDALAQAQKAIWRLASLGGYSERDLSYALDLENNCVRLSSSGACTKYATRSAVTLWAQTWLGAVAEKTGRLPFLYSYPRFLESAMNRSAELLQYPLWMAHYAINPADPLAQPGQKIAGCFVHSWTTANCSSLWMIWQYSSCGIAKKYGVPGSRVDLNVFRGTPNTFLDLLKGIWIPEVADLMPTLEPSQLTLNSLKATTSDKPVIFNVTVVRPTGDPVVTGSVRFIVDKGTPFPLKPVQSAIRASSGNWVLTIKGIPAGIWPGKVMYTDISKTHATSDVPVVLTVEQGEVPTPSPSTSPKPKPTPAAPVDGCKNQIIN